MGDFEDLLAIAMLQGLRNNEDILSRASSLDVPFNDVYENRRPNARDYDNRRDLIRIFNAIAKELYGNHEECPIVEEFGSFVMDMFNAQSDLDLSINFSDKKFASQRHVQIETLRKFSSKLHNLQRKGYVRKVQTILSARVPVLKVTDGGTGIECDLSVGNVDGIAKSQITLMISAIDERFRKLSFLMKDWAKAHDINSSFGGTLNSLSLILLTAFHLQTRDPPILPPFSEIFKDGTDPVVVKKTVLSFSNYGEKNKESLAELFVSLLIVLESVEKLWSKGLCASTYEASWKCTPLKSKNGYIGVEDFIDRTQNTARAVKSKKMNKIYSCIRKSLKEIRNFVNGKIDAVELKIQLFGPYQLAENIGRTNISQHNLGNLLKKHKSKKRKHTEERKKQTEGGSTKRQKGSKKSDDSSPPPLKLKGSKKSESSLPASKRKGSKKSESSLPPTSSQKRVAIVGRSQETLGVSHGHALPHSNPFNQNSVGFRPPAMPLDRSQETLGVNRGHALTHFNSLNQNSVGFRPPAMPLDRSQETLGVNRGHTLSHSNPYSHNSLGFRPPAMPLDRSHETLGVNHGRTLSHSNLFSENSREFRPPPMPLDTWRYGDARFPSSVPHPHRPYFPSVPYTTPVGFERPNNPSQPFPFANSPFPRGFHSPDYRNQSFHAPDHRNSNAPQTYARPVSMQRSDPTHHQHYAGPNPPQYPRRADGPQHYYL